MEIGFYRNIGLAALACSVLMISACATIKPEEAVNAKAGEVTQETSRKATTETGRVIGTTTNRTETVKPGEQNVTATQVSNGKTDSQQNITAKIIKTEKSVQIKSAASNKSRTVARIKGGKLIEILEEKGNWLKIRWQEKDKTREGWSRKEYVELIAN